MVMFVVYLLNFYINKNIISFSTMIFIMIFWYINNIVIDGIVAYERYFGWFGLE